MRHLKRTIVLTALMALALGVLPAMAQMGMGMHGQGRAANNPDSFWSDGLTAEQQRVAGEIYDRHYTIMDKKQSQLYGVQSKLTGELYSPTPDTGEIRDLADEAAKLMGELYRERIDMQLEMLEAGLPSNQVCGRLGGGHMMMGPGGGGWGGGHMMMGPGGGGTGRGGGGRGGNMMRGW